MKPKANIQSLNCTLQEPLAESLKEILRPENRYVRVNGNKKMSTIPSEARWLEATAKACEGAEQAESVDLETSRPPVHPVHQLQGPFEESILQSHNGSRFHAVVDLDAQSRRDQLLAEDRYERLCGRRWRQKTDERYHPLWKLIAQVTFGLHLLARGSAKSELDVVKILQSHVAEFDEFIERTTEDFVLTRNDIRERLKCLMLPLENLDIFDGMLEDRWFRYAVIKDNEKIEHIIERSTMSMNDSFKDIKKGIDSVHALRHYLKQLEMEWEDRPHNLDAVYEAMIGNADGWDREFDRLQKEGYNLALYLAQLSKAVSKMQRRVGVASRKTVVSNPPRSSRRSRTRSHTFRKLQGGSLNRLISDKPLPRYPQNLGPVLNPEQVSKKSPLTAPVVKRGASFPSQHETVSTRPRSFGDARHLHRASISALCISLKNTTAKESQTNDPAWEMPHDIPTATIRSASAPSLSHETRQPSQAEFETSIMTQGKSHMRIALESLLQLDRRRSLASTREDHRRVQLLHGSKSKIFDFLRLSGTREQSRPRSQSNKDKVFKIFLLNSGMI